MKKHFFGFLIFCSACNSSKKGLEYQDSSNKFYVTTEKSEKNGLVDTLYKFYDFNKPSEMREVGFYKDGFRNDIWNYNLPTEVKTIKWAYYIDSFLNFETNLFEQADSVKHGDFFTKFVFNIENSKIGLTVSVNGAFKDSLPEKNYKRITENEFSLMGVTALKFDTSKIVTNLNDIYINNVVIKTTTNNLKYLKGCFSFLDKNHFIEFSVSSSTENNFYADELFNGVLTNFVMDGKRLYNPFKQEEK